MSSKNLDNLFKSNLLKLEPFDLNEFNGLIDSGIKRLKDAQIETLSKESSFDLAYNAAHALALAALRKHGYRAQNRYIVFQVLPYTLGLGPEVWRVLSKCHDCRNLAEYEGHSEIDDQLLSDLIKTTKILAEHVKDLQVMPTTPS